MDRTKASDAFNAGSIPVGCSDAPQREDERKTMIVNNQDRKPSFSEKMFEIKEWFLGHSKLIMPIILVLCVVVTVTVAINANQKEKLEKEAIKTQEAASAEETPSADIGVIETPEYELEENTHPEINDVVRKYYDAQANGDIETISSMNTYLNDIEILRIKELSNYIESYPEINVYTKPGITDNAYVAYVCSMVKFNDVETPMPGMQAYYIGTDTEGNYYINDGTHDETIYSYIMNVTVQDDVVDLNNRVAVEYNNLIENDAELNEFIAYLKEKINEEVGEILAQTEAPATQTTPDEPTDDNQPVVSATIVNKVRALERVNIRKSDSTGSDRVGSASPNEEFELVEKRGNGWTAIKYQGETAFIKTEFLEDVESVQVDIPGTEDNKVEAGTASDNTKVSGKVTVKEGGVRIRKEPNTDCDVVGTAYVGEKYDYIEQTNGWTKIKYKNGYAYIKSDYVTKE